jgi:phage/plasmid-like protein (TIGR03299 family)
MAFAHETPWHGLGVNVDADLPVDNWLHMAGLDWEVEFRPMQTTLADGTVVEVPSHRALVRKTDNRLLTVTGDRWVPSQNKDSFEFFKMFTEAGGAKMETAGSLKGGQIVWGLASLNDKFTVAGKTDTVKGFLLLVSPHQAGRAIITKVTGVRVVCANTLAMATAGTGAIERRFSHVKAFDPQVAADAMGLIREEFSAFGKLANQLAGLRLSQAEVLGVLGPVYDAARHAELGGAYTPSRNVERVLAAYQDAPGATPGTGWGLLNAVTYDADHGTQASNADQRLTSAWLGAYAGVKAKVLDKLTEMVD